MFTPKLRKTIKTKQGYKMGFLLKGTVDIISSLKELYTQFQVTFDLQSGLCLDCVM